MRDRRTIIIAAAALSVVALVARHPTADIRVLTHEAGDPAPRTMKAVVDLGLVGVSVFYSWTGGPAG